MARNCPERQSGKQILCGKADGPWPYIHAAEFRENAIHNASGAVFRIAFLKNAFAAVESRSHFSHFFESKMQIKYEKNAKKYDGKIGMRKKAIGNAPIPRKHMHAIVALFRNAFGCNNHKSHFLKMRFAATLANRIFQTCVGRQSAHVAFLENAFCGNLANRIFQKCVRLQLAQIAFFKNALGAKINQPKVYAAKI